MDIYYKIITIITYGVFVFKRLELFGQNTKYLDWYFKIIMVHGSSIRKPQTEGHHVYPRFFNIENNTTVVFVSYRVHFLLHCLLYLHFKKINSAFKYKAGSAIRIMGGGKMSGQNDVKLHGSKWFSLRRECIHLPKSPEHAARISAALTGLKKSEDHINKINKNPEKIAKMAAKHRGMKRSEETRANISKSKLGKPSFNKGLVTYYNPTTLEVFYFNKDDANIPTHLKRGNPALIGKKKPRKTYYHPLTMDIQRIIVGDDIPEGYIKGDPTRLGKPKKK